MSLEASQISVVIPTLDECECIADTLANLSGSGVGEVIVVDGGSVDATAEIAEAHGARVLHTPRGRGPQQNAGARAARGDALVFLHADTRLPADFPRRVIETLSRPEVAAGAFRFKLDESGAAARWLELTVSWRCRLWQLPYGDQAIFTRAETFHRVGGFPDTAAMEDYELIRRLKRQGRVAIVDADAVTSARRWRELGYLRATWSNQLCLLAYWFRIEPKRIVRRRRTG